MKYIKRYKIFEDHIATDIDEVEFELDKYEIEGYTVTEDLYVSVDGNVYLDDYVMYDLPVYFDRVKGDFVATRCRLCSFGGIPKVTYGHLDVSNNYLKDFDISYFPIAKSYNFDNNQISEELLNKIDQEIIIVGEYGLWNSDGSLNEARYKIYCSEFNRFK